MFYNTVTKLTELSITLSMTKPKYWYNTVKEFQPNYAW